MKGWQKLCQETWKELFKRCSSDDQNRDPDEENSMGVEKIPLREKGSGIQENTEAICYDDLDFYDLSDCDYESEDNDDTQMYRV